MVTEKKRIIRLLLLLCVLLSCSAAFPIHAAAATFHVRVKQKNYLEGEQSCIEFKNTKTITYKFKSSNKKVFKVNRQGVITARGKGKATLTVQGTWKKGSQKKTWSKKISIRVYKAGLSKSMLSIRPTDTRILTVKGNKVNRKVSWVSETPEICSVSSEGEVTGLREGTGTICAEVGPTVRLRCSVVVAAQELSPASVRLLVNRRHVNGSVNLAEVLDQEAGSAGETVYETSSPLTGHMEGGIYFADENGTNTITAYRGPYKKTFSIRQEAWCAHRGYADMFPENTLDAFEGAALAGAGFVETDIRVTADGEAVCIHDNTLATMTNAEAKATVSKTTLAGIRELTINNGNGLEKLVHRQVPTFEEYIQICARYEMIASIELKSLGKTPEMQKAVSEKMMEVLRRYGMEEKCMVISSNAALLKAFRDYSGSQIPMAPLGSAGPELQAYNLPAVYTSHKTTPFGSFISSEYSPLVGRMNRPLSEYRSR